MLTIDRAAAARFGVTLAAIDQTLYDAFGQRQIATIYGPLTQYHVILELDPAQTRRCRRLEPDLHHPVGVASGDQRRIGQRHRRRLPSAFACRAARRGGAGGAPAGAARRSPIRGCSRRLRCRSTSLLAPSLSEAIAQLHEAEREIGLAGDDHRQPLRAAPNREASLRNEGWLILAAIVTGLHRAGRAVRDFITR